MGEGVLLRRWHVERVLLATCLPLWVLIVHDGGRCLFLVHVKQVALLVVNQLITILTVVHFKVKLFEYVYFPPDRLCLLSHRDLSLVNLVDPELDSAILREFT